MKSLTSKKIVLGLILVVFIFGLSQISAFAEYCLWCKSESCGCEKPIDLSKEPITGDYEKYEIEIVRKTSPEQVQTRTKKDANTLLVTIPVDAGEKDTIRGVQFKLSKMRNIILTFYDNNEFVDEFTIYSKENDIWSMPVYGNKVVVKSKRIDKKTKPEFKIDTIKYNKTLQHQHRNEKEIEYLSIKGDVFVKETSNFKSYIDKLTIPGLKPTTIRITEDAADHEKSQADVLYQVLHGNLSGLYFEPYKEMKALTSSSLADWIIQKSCLAVNTNIAREWCNYITSNPKHKTKGVFGFSVVTYAGSSIHSPYVDYFVRSSQTKPMLDSYLGSNAEIAADKNGIVSGRMDNMERESYAHANVIINEYNTKDSMFRVADTPSNSKYRFYRLAKSYTNLDFTQYTFYKGVKSTSKGGKTYLVLQYEDGTLDREVEIGVNTSGNEMEYILNRLNTMSLDEFDTKFVNGYTIPKEVQDLRKPGYEMVYKRLALYYAGMKYLNKLPYYTVCRPDLKLVKFGDRFVAEYAELEKKSDGYDFVKDISGNIIWNQEVLWGYKNKNGGEKE